MLERAIKAAMGVRSRKLRIDIARNKEMLEMGEVEEIKQAPGKEQVAESLTKDGGKLELLRNYVECQGKRRKGAKIE